MARLIFNCFCASLITLTSTVLLAGEKSESQQNLNIQLAVSASAFGPITFDRLGVYAGTGVEKRDPHFFSYEPSLKLENILDSGGLYLRLLVRYFRPTENNTSGSYDEERQVSTSGKLTVFSSGAGLEFGWNFRKRANRSASIFPYIGLAAERNNVEVKGYVHDPGELEQQVNFTSTLNGIYTRLGLDWRVMTGPVELDILTGIYIPLWADVVDTVESQADLPIRERLRHGMRTGVYLGFAAGVASGTYDRELKRKKKRKRRR